LSEGHLLVEATNRELKKANKTSRKLSYNAEVSGSAGFQLFDKAFRHRHKVSDSDDVVVINTGRGYGWERIQRRRRNRKIGCLSSAFLGLLAVGSLLYPRSPSPDLLIYADLNKDGVITDREMYETHLIVGTYDWNADWERASRQYEEIREDPWIDNSTLERMKKEDGKFREQIEGIYSGDFSKASMHLWGLGGIKKSFDELSHDQMLYLKTRFEFVNLKNPELWSAMKFTDWYDRLIKLREGYQPI